MKTRTKWLAAALAAALTLTPLVSQAGVGVVVRIGPPAPRVERVPPPRHGYVWAPGYWAWRGHAHVWVGGHWMVARRGYHWVPDHWVHRPGAWAYVPGHWVR